MFVMFFCICIAAPVYVQPDFQSCQIAFALAMRSAVASSADLLYVYDSAIALSLLHTLHSLNLVVRFSQTVMPFPYLSVIFSS